MEKLIGTIGAARKVLTRKKLGTKYWSKRFNLSVFAMNAVDVRLAYQCTARTEDNQYDFYNYISGEIIDTTYARFMILSSEGRRRTIVDSDDNTFDDDNPLFERINGDPRGGISLHVTPHQEED